MYLLYLDESGNERDTQDRHFVLAGVAVSEYQAYGLSQALDTIQAKYLPGHEPIPFHATDIRNGKKFWRRQDKALRKAVLQDIAAAIRNIVIRNVDCSCSRKGTSTTVLVCGSVASENEGHSGELLTTWLIFPILPKLTRHGSYRLLTS